MICKKCGHKPLISSYGFTSRFVCSSFRECPTCREVCEFVPDTTESANNREIPTCKYCGGEIRYPKQLCESLRNGEECRARMPMYTPKPTETQESVHKPTLTEERAYQRIDEYSRKTSHTSIPARKGAEFRYTQWVYVDKFTT